jgi:RecA-family ATPase
VTQRPQSNDSAKLATRMMATVTRKNVEWVWRDRIAFGKPCLVAGDPGEGKSTMLCQVAAMISRGGKLPDDDEVRPPKDVLIISAEDDPEDTVWDRLAAANADIDRIFWVDGVSRDADGKPVGFFNVTTDLDRLEGTLTEPGKDFALVILDPFDAYLGGQVDTHRSASVRDATGPFQKLLERTHVGGALSCTSTRERAPKPPTGSRGASPSLPLLARPSWSATNPMARTIRCAMWLGSRTQTGRRPLG